LLNDFDMLSSYLMQEENQYFMHRDCQSRNIMVKDVEVLSGIELEINSYEPRKNKFNHAA